jgi:hypothetical protein
MSIDMEATWQTERETVNWGSGSTSWGKLGVRQHFVTAAMLELDELEHRVPKLPARAKGARRRGANRGTTRVHETRRGLVSRRRVLAAQIAANAKILSFRFV